METQLTVDVHSVYSEAMTKNLTEQQAREVVASMRMTPPQKDALLAQWLLGDPSARFVVFNAYKRANG